MSQKKTIISYGSFRELRWLEDRENNRPPTDIGELANAFERYDPEGRRAQELSKKYSGEKQPHITPK